MGTMVTTSLAAQDVDKQLAMVIYATDATNPENSALIAYFDEMRLMKREGEESGILALNGRYSRLTSLETDYHKTYGFAFDYAKLLSALGNKDTLKTLRFVEEIKAQEALEEMVRDYRPSNKYFKVSDEEVSSYDLRKSVKQDGVEVEESPTSTEIGIPGQLVFDESEAAANQVVPGEETNPEVSSPYRFTNNIKLESFGKVYHILIGSPDAISSQIATADSPVKIFNKFWHHKVLNIRAFQSEIGEKDLFVDGLDGAFLVSLKQQSRPYLVVPSIERIGTNQYRDAIISTFTGEVSETGDWDIHITDEALFASVLKPLLSPFPPTHPEYKNWSLQYRESAGELGLVRLTPPEGASENYPEYAVHLELPADNSSSSVVQFQLTENGRWQYRVVFSGAD
jgi:hypothetical protein